MPTSRSEPRSTPHRQHEVRAHHARPVRQRVQFKIAVLVYAARPPVCVSVGKLPTCVCHWTPTLGQFRPALKAHLFGQ